MPFLAAFINDVANACLQGACGNRKEARRLTEELIAPSHYPHRALGWLHAMSSL